MTVQDLRLVALTPLGLYHHLALVMEFRRIVIHLQQRRCRGIMLSRSRESTTRGNGTGRVLFQPGWNGLMPNITFTVLQDGDSWLSIAVQENIIDVVA